MELMSAVLERGNMIRAYERVLQNKGAPGVDGMTVGDLKNHLQTDWPEIREQLRGGRYQPLPVRKVEIPEPGLDGWIRRHLRKILWRQWKRPFTRAKKLMRLGLSEARAWTSAANGRGPWWNSGASHLNQALPRKLFDRLGLISLMSRYHRLKCMA